MSIPRATRSFCFAFLLAGSAAALGCAATTDHAIPSAHSMPDKDPAVEQRVDSLLSQMTLEEKIDHIGGVDGFYIHPIERLGLPAIKMSDGPVGMRNDGETTAYPAGIALAATWNTELADRYGRAVGRDGRARGVHIWLAPGLNIYRAPQCGRNFEYFGEDPYLAGRMAVALVRNVQAQGVLATLKHYAGNNQEYDRHHISSDIDERTLREIYLPAFEAAVRDAHAACIMNAYNLLNGVHCTENKFLNLQVAKTDWGFDGVIMSDWGATYDGVAAANGGLDLEMPSGKYMNRQNLIPAIEAGIVSEATIDDKVRRILRVIVRAGFLDRPQKIDSIPLDDPDNARVALDIAREGIVLLKNDNALLPLDASKIKTIAVIGPNAHPGVPAGGGSSHTTPFHSVSLLDGVKARVGKNITVLHEPGRDPLSPAGLAPISRFEHLDDNGNPAPGLRAEYFPNQYLEGEPAVTTIVPRIEFDWASGAPEGLPKDDFSARWTGRIRPEKSGRYLLAESADDGIRVFLDGEEILEDWSDHAARTQSIEKTLEAGRAYELKIEYYERGGDASALFGWGLIEEGNQLPAARAARNADVAIVCVGFNRNEEFEGADRPFELPAHQQAIVRSVAAENPRTIVVLMAGGGVAWDDWLDRIPAVVHAWYPGQEGGTALAEILFGDVNPSGKLPATFEKKWEDNPAAPYYHSKDNKALPYTEGIFVGYRGYDQSGVEPQFCFGHGLSYTTFEYSDLEIHSGAARPGESVRVSFKIKNTGSRPGSEAAQVYVHDIESRLPRPPKELKGFAKISLAPGKSEFVTIDLDERAFAFFDPEAKQWIVEPGTFEILVGASSRDIRLTDIVEHK